MKKNILTILILLIIIFATHTVLAKNETAGERILEKGQEMVNDGEIIKGSCWDFIDATYNRAGYPLSKRELVFKGTKNSGPYANIDTIEPGDWLYYINYSYHNVEHSGIFVKWVDRDNKIAQTLSYQGENRSLPGRYKNYDLKSVYTIIRAKGGPNQDLKPDNDGEFSGKKCSAGLIMTQNLRAPSHGEGYIRNGSYHSYTREVVQEADILQKHLNRLGFDAGDVDGIIGPLTKGAILRMQAFLGTVRDGFVGPITRELLNNSC